MMCEANSIPSEAFSKNLMKTKEFIESITMDRHQILESHSEISLNGVVIRKLDFLGAIHIYGEHYFNVYRRYNSVYEIILEDCHGELYFHKDYTIRQSLQQMLCVNEDQMKNMYTIHATSVKHGSCPSTRMQDAPNMRWSQLHQEWHAAILDFGGILEAYYHDERHQDMVDEQEEQERQPHILNADNEPIVIVDGTREVRCKRTWTQTDDHLCVLRNGKAIKK
jgi:hypothetical protein